MARRFLWFTLVGWLNVLVLQWLCVRLCAAVDVESGHIVSLAVLAPIAPLTGWWSDYWPQQHRAFHIWTAERAEVGWK